MGVDLTGNNKPWELSLYELNRKPQPLITDDSEIAVKPRSLQSELMCPICLDMLKVTMTTKECLHRFCQDCITTALRSGNKECPTCRKKLVSRRSLRPDPNFDALISKIYPSREDYEKNQEVIGYKENTSRRNNRAKNNFASNPDSTTGSCETNNNHHVQQPEIELVFKPLTQGSPDDHIHTRFLKTTTNATINHLIKYLSMRHFLETNPNNSDNNQELDTSVFTIYVAAGPGEFQPLHGQTTLDQVNEKFWKMNKPLELYYAYKMSVEKPL